MALKGTLKDFGIADILQLIGQQQKSGTLHLKNKDQEVDVAFKDGSIVKAESTTRKKKDLIGTMLVRAEVITEAQLEQALETQRRTLKRLGDVLVTQGLLTAERFKQMVQLQATETLYGLFGWKSGTYEFQQGEPELDGDSMSPLRAESVLMEGFRMVDEWPVIRQTISRPDMTFQVLKPLPPPKEQPAGGDGFDNAFDDAFAEKKKDENKGEFKSVGDSERRIFELITANARRDVRQLIDMSCLGEFETSKALLNLVNLEYVRAIYPEGKSRAPSSGASFVERLGAAAARVGVTVGVLGLLGLVGSWIDFDSVSLSASPSASYADPAAQHQISQAQISRIEAALDVYRLEKGEVPDKLDALVDAGLLGREDLHYPWRDGYYYRRVASGGFVLLPPLR
ncbi:MAG TPA: DUF4388 domain-containing protein [Myxococcaceae bacterium]|nr:DUF4388 domain-containing protein [Myxococcaceae bacterium]